MKYCVVFYILLISLFACTEQTQQMNDGDLLSDVGITSDQGMNEQVDLMTPDPLAAADMMTSDELFDPEQLIEVNIELNDDDWQLIRSEGRSLVGTFTGCERSYEYTYVTGQVTVDGQTYEDVSVRKKGFLGSLSMGRPSLKLNFGRIIEGQTHATMKRMTLNNNKQDPSNTHQCMAYELFRKAGVIAPRCNFAHVTVNGEDLGIYTHVESVKKPMLSRYFDDIDGNLYEGQGVDFVSDHREHIELKTNEQENNREDFDRLSDALLQPDEQLISALSEVIDLDSFLNFWVMEVMTGHWDSYSGGRNNYLTYFDPVSSRFHFIPWGTDGAFSMLRPFTPGNHAASVLAQGLIANRLYNHSQGRMMYFDRLRELLELTWNEEELLNEADRIQRLTGAPQQSIEVQKSFIIEHGAALYRELDMSPVEWIGGEAPGPIMCYEQATSAMSGSFSMIWSAMDMPRPGQSLDMELNREPWIPSQLFGTAGPSQQELNIAQIRYVSPLSDGSFLILILSIPQAYFVTGQHPMHGFETNGLIFKLNPQSPSSPIMIGIIGDGFIQLDEASMEEGGTVSGSFEGQLLQLRPL